MNDDIWYISSYTNKSEENELKVWNYRYSHKNMNIEKKEKKGKK